jgi:site-specific recombinase XerD
MVTLFKRGRIFHVQASFNGHTKRWSLQTRDRVIADALRRQIELRMLGGGSLGPKTCPEFAREFEQSLASQVRPNTQKYYVFILNKLVEFLEKRAVFLISDVTPATISDFMAERRLALHPSRKRTMTNGGERAYLRVLHRIFAFAVELEYIRKNPVVATNRNAIAGQTQPFSPDEVTAMLTTPYLDDKHYLRAIVLLFLHTGLRIGDVIDIKKADVEGACLNITARKNNQALRLPLNTELREALNLHQVHELPEQKASSYLFTTANGARIVGLDKHLRRLFAAAGVAHGHAHRFRDTFAVNLLEQGASLYDVAKLLGINGAVVEAHYAPYVKELQERGRQLVSRLNYTKAVITEPVPQLPEDSERIESIRAKVWTN